MISFYATINITLVAFAIALSVLLCVAIIIRKNRRTSARYMLFVTFAEILLLITVLLQWLMYAYREHMTFYKYSFVLVYLLCAIIVSGIHLYIISFINESKRVLNQDDYIPIWLSRICIPIGIIGTLIFASSLWTEWIYYFDENGIEHFTQNYIFLLFVLFSVFIPDTFLIFKNRSIIGSGNVVMLYLCWIIPLCTFPFDVTQNLDVSIISIVIIIFIMYISIDIRQSELLLEQEALLALKEQELVENKSRLLLSQIQPHFIFNTLNTIRYLVSKDPDKALESIDSFSQYLRYGINSYSKTNNVSLEDELATVKNYLFLEKERFGKRLNIVYEIEAEDFYLPPLSLQTVVENAVKHGVCKKIEGGTVTISSYKTDEANIICVKDDGVGFEKDKIYEDKNLHLGIKNTVERIAIMTGGKVDIQSTVGVGTTVTFYIPIGVEEIIQTNNH